MGVCPRRWPSRCWRCWRHGRRPPWAEDPPLRRCCLFEEPTVSAAAKHPQTIDNAPSSVSVITREDIRRFGYRTLAEALRSQRGFYGTYDRDYDYIGVRGFLRPGDYNDRILLLVNGQVYNDDIYQTAPLGYDFGIDLEAIDHIEVIRGPGSALYGGNALFAVVNVVTLTGREAPGVAALAETGSFWRKRGQTNIGHTFENGGDVFASGSVMDVDGQRDLFYPAYDSPRTNFGHARNDDSERAYNFFLNGSYKGFTLQGGANSREKQIPTGAFGTTFNDPGTTTVDGRQFADLRYTTEPLENVTVAGRAFYNGVRYHGTFIYGGGVNRIKNEDLANSNWLGGEVTTRWQVTPEWALTGGTEYTYHPRVEQENFDKPTGTQYLHDVRDYWDARRVRAGRVDATHEPHARRRRALRPLLQPDRGGEPARGGHLGSARAHHGEAPVGKRVPARRTCSSSTMRTVAPASARSRTRASTRRRS
jgi:iron complex outermembrane receptor protein